VPAPIEDYALLGDTESAALVGKDGSVDWLALPRFDSPACFAALLGGPDNGRWRIAPAGPVTAVRRRYRDGTLVLETEMDTVDGTVAVVDCMPIRDREANLVRVVEGRRGRVPVRMDLTIRFDYGKDVPWVRRTGDGRLVAVCGPDAVYLDTPVPTRGEGLSTVAEVTVGPGDRVPFALSWHPSHLRPPRRLDAVAAVAETERWWQRWIASCAYEGDWAEDVRRSLVVLKALTYHPTGAIVAAPTTSLPEQLGGSRNWDYRYSWLRDATFTLISLLGAGYTTEAVAWRDWLLRAVAGEPSKLQIMYGVAGERRLPEWTVDWLPGYESSGPVRVGNAAADQFQLDVWGEVLDALYQSRATGIPDESWALQRALMDFLEGNWREPDEGIWEVRGPRRHFTHSKVMAWVAADRAVKACRSHGLDGPVDRWRRLGADIRAEVLEKGVDDRGVFVQHYDTTDLDASLLRIPLVGFLPPTDERVVNTVEAIATELCEDGFVHRYRPHPDLDGLPPAEGAFLMCTFWLADCWTMLGRRDEAVRIFERLRGVANDVGLLAEEYDPGSGRLLGNFPQAFSHVSLVNTVSNLCAAGGGAAAHRCGHRAGDEPLVRSAPA
jgi:GH15 family glucan-1,4-alpha-glucosidase